MIETQTVMTLDPSKYGMNEFRIDIRMRNNRLLRLRETFRGNVHEFCAAVGISYSAFCDLAGMRVNPIRKDGQWREATLKLADYAGVLPDDLFPETVRAVTDPKRTLEVSAERVAELMPPVLSMLPSPDRAAEQAETRDLVARALSRLRPREAEVIRLRYGFDDGVELTYEQIAERLDLTRERIRQIEFRALRRIRESGKYHALRSAHTGYQSGKWGDHGEPAEWEEETWDYLEDDDD